jgi:hypothetical protein
MAKVPIFFFAQAREVGEMLAKYFDGAIRRNQ